MLSPHSNGLFHRLIAESGTPLSPSWSYLSPERGLNFGQQIINKVGCDHFWILDKGQEISKGICAALNSLKKPTNFRPIL